MKGSYNTHWDNLNEYQKKQINEAHKQRMEVLSLYWGGLPFKQISKEVEKSEKGIRKILSRYDISSAPAKRNESFIRHRYFDNIETEENAYILGFLTGDGWTASNNNSIGVQQLNTPSRWRLMRRIRDEIARGVALSSKKDRINRAVLLNFNSKWMSKRLKELQVTPDKTEGTTIPEDIPQDLVRDFIRGLIDSDGSPCVSNQVPYITLAGSKTLVQEVERYLRSNMDVPKMKLGSRPHWDEKTKSVQYSGSSARKVFMHVWNNSSIYLPEKYKKLTRYGFPNIANLLS